MTKAERDALLGHLRDAQAILDRSRGDDRMMLEGALESVRDALAQAEAFIPTGGLSH